MIRVRIERERGGRITGFTVRGHAGYADRGQDIVCAGVTAVVFTALEGLKAVAGVPHTVRQDGRRGYVECRLGEGASEEQAARAQTILETMVLGLRDIEKDYAGHVRVEGG